MSATEIEYPGLDRTPPLAEQGQSLLSEWSNRRQEALTDRRKHEPIWSICEHFLAGRQWIAWAGEGRSGRVINEPNPAKRERHTVNVITARFETVLGKLFVEDLRPTIVFTRDDEESESVTTHTRAAARYLWDTELAADQKLHGLLTKLLTYGTAAMRCYFDSTRGEEIGMFPVGPDGQPILDPRVAREYVAMLQTQGQQAQFVTLREGKVMWEALSPRNILPPPGVTDEAEFPWLIIERAMPLEWAKMKFPRATGELREQELRTHESLGVTVEQGGGNAPATAGKLKGHLLVTTGYEMPCAKYPNGRVVTWHDESKILLDVADNLPYKLRSEPHHGITFFHFHRLPQRFWSRGVVEDLIGPQRQKNRARSQMIEMKDRNLGRVYAKKGTITAQNKPVGKIMELIEVPLHAEFPQETMGTPPGPWIENEARINDEDMDRVSGLGEVSLGHMPSGSAAYSALALMVEQDERRVGPTLKMLRIGIGDAMVLSLELARRYWQENKQMAIAGPEGSMELFMFTRSGLPMEFHVDVSRHAPLPTSPAVESQKIFDIFHAATSAGQPLPIEWLKASLDSGRALPIPKTQDQVQMSKAQIENVLMAQLQPTMPDYYDDDYLHILVHRQAQTEHMANPQVAQIIEMHVQMHAQNMQMKRPTQSGGEVPQLQGGHGIEAQNGASPNAQGAAQAAYGDAPLSMPS